LRLITAGNVDDGKSTLIGRLLHDTENVKSDLLQSLTPKSSSNINLAHLTDGLRDERALGITVDVAYQYFTTKNRKYILTDAPGHFMYTKNLVTGASCVDIMIILIDAQHGISAQTKKHTLVASFLKPLTRWILLIITVSILKELNSST
jgi:sulfate adenylyltransferase subunit 1